VSSWKSDTDPCLLNSESQSPLLRGFPNSWLHQLGHAAFPLCSSLNRSLASSISFYTDPRGRGRHERSPSSRTVYRAPEQSVYESEGCTLWLDCHHGWNKWLGLGRTTTGNIWGIAWVASPSFFSEPFSSQDSRLKVIHLQYWVPPFQVSLLSRLPVIDKSDLDLRESLGHSPRNRRKRTSSERYRGSSSNWHLDPKTRYIERAHCRP